MKINKPNPSEQVIWTISKPRYCKHSNTDKVEHKDREDDYQKTSYGSGKDTLALILAFRITGRGGNDKGAVEHEQQG